LLFSIRIYVNVQLARCDLGNYFQRNVSTTNCEVTQLQEKMAEKSSTSIFVLHPSTTGELLLC